MKDRYEWIHSVLDQEEHDEESSPPEEIDSKILACYQEAVHMLSELQDTAPEGFVDRVMTSLPGISDSRWSERISSFLSTGKRWILSALAGAFAALMLMVGIKEFHSPPVPARVTVTFEVHAPEAHRVEVVGSFNNWKPGEIIMRGPDAAGYWTVTVELPPGRHEYAFLVNSKEWLIDPRAAAYRPDGFGRHNSLIEL